MNKKDLGWGIVFWAILLISAAVVILVDLPFQQTCLLSLLILLSALGGPYFTRKAMYGTGEY